MILLLVYILYLFVARHNNLSVYSSNCNDGLNSFYLTKCLQWSYCLYSEGNFTCNTFEDILTFDEESDWT